MKEYEKWRESEAYAVPMTPDGVKWAQERWRGFSTGYKRAVKDAVNLLMSVKSSHNYWHVAANLIKDELVHASDTSQERVNKTAKNEHEWVGLTDDELEELEVSSVDHKWGHLDASLLSRAIEAKLKEKNT